MQNLRRQLVESALAEQRGQVLHSRIQPNPAFEWDGAKARHPSI